MASPSNLSTKGRPLKMNEVAIPIPKTIRGRIRMPSTFDSCDKPNIHSSGKIESRSKLKTAKADSVPSTIVGHMKGAFVPRNDNSCK